MKGCIFIVSAPSGAGKSTVLKRVMAHIPGLVFSVSHTTRNPRPGEEDGRDYHFISREEFIRLRDQGGFLEWAEVHGNFYGTSGEAVNRQTASGRDVVLDIDVQGASQVMARVPDAVSIFILPPSHEELERRLRGRGTEDEATMRRRLAAASGEMARARDYGFVVINDDLDRAVAQVEGIILAERARARRTADGAPIPAELMGR